MKKRIKLLAVLLGMSVYLTACGGKNTDEATSEAASTAESEIVDEELGNQKTKLEQRKEAIAENDAAEPAATEGQNAENQEANPETEATAEAAPDQETQEAAAEVPAPVLDASYVTQWAIANMVTYPDFVFDYPSTWTINSQVSQTSEIVTLTNSRQVTLQYSYYMTQPGGLGQVASQAEITPVADSQFVPTIVQDSDHSDLGSFMVASIQITGSMGPTDSNYVPVENNLVHYAVLPQSWTGTKTDLMGLNDVAYSFDYSGLVSFCTMNVGDGLTEAEKQEVIAILSSFRYN